VARMWPAAACLAARTAGRVTWLTAGEVVSWRAVRDELLPRLWQHRRSRADVSSRGRASGPGDLVPGRGRLPAGFPERAFDGPI